MGLPLGNDQLPNLLRAERAGWAVRLDWVGLTSHLLAAAVTRAVTESDLRANAQKLRQ